MKTPTWLSGLLAARLVTCALPGASIVDPLLDGVKSTGPGLVHATLGVVGGVLGVDEEFDYVVVGGGTAGNTLGYRLAEAGHSVAIIEAGASYEIGKPVLGSTPLGSILGVGTNPIDTNPLVDWGFVTEPQAGVGGRQLHILQGRCLGGSSAVNLMVYQRSTRGSFDKWATEVADDSWRFDSLLPFFKKSVDFAPPDGSKRLANATTIYHDSDFAPPGQGGKVHVTYSNWVNIMSTFVAKALDGMGIDVNGDFERGSLFGWFYGQATLNPKTQARSSSADYVYAARDDRMINLKVFEASMVQRVLIDDDKKATGVEVATSLGGPKYTIKARREVVVSAGAFHSPQLLMLSGVGPADTLRQFDIPVVSDLPGVGQNMHDHTQVSITQLSTVTTAGSILVKPLQLAKALKDYIVDQSGPFTSNLADLIAWESLKGKADLSPSTRAALDEYPDDWPEHELYTAGGYIGDFSVPVLQQPLNGKNYASTVGVNLKPLSRGNVTIASTNPFDKPLVNPNWLLHPGDREVALAIYRRHRQIWDTPVLRSIREEPIAESEVYPGADKSSDEDLNEVLTKSLSSVLHYSCTCKMGRDGDDMAVLDSRARVRGVKNLRVVDASAMPFLPPGHPQSAIYAMAEKIADDILKSSS